MRRREFIKKTAIAGLAAPLSLTFNNSEHTGVESKTCRVSSGNRGVIMGIDQIFPPLSDKSLCFRIEGPNFFIKDTCEWDYVDTLMCHYQVDLCVVDKYPELYMAQKFSARYLGHVLLGSHMIPCNPCCPLIISMERNEKECWQTVKIPILDYLDQGYHPGDEMAKAYCRVAHDLYRGKFICGEPV